jgi:hypothetical protein
MGSFLLPLCALTFCHFTTWATAGGEAGGVSVPEAVDPHDLSEAIPPTTQTCVKE